MGESLLLITLITLVVLTIRRARPVILDNHVTINRPGRYQIILAPQLNRAQTFIEQIAKPYLLLHPPQADLSTLYFEVRDPIVYAKGASVYLLAVTLRDGMLYFQAVNPQLVQNEAGSHIKTLREFTETEMAKHPLSEPANQQWAEKLRGLVGATAGQMKITVKELQTTAQ